MLTYLLIFISNAGFFYPGTIYNIFKNFFLIINEYPFTLTYIILFFIVWVYIKKLGKSLLWFHRPPSPHAFVNIEINSGLHTYIKKVIYFLYSKKLNIILSLGGLILLLLPLKVCFIILDLMDYFPLVSATYACLFTAVSLLCNTRNLPNILAFINIFTCALFISFCISQCNISDLSYLFLSLISYNGFLLIDTAYPINNIIRPVLFMDNQVPNSGGQRNDLSFNNDRRLTSNDPSLNITSDIHKTEVENFYTKEENHYYQNKNLLGNALNSFKRHWDKTKIDLSNPEISNEVREARIEEAKKKCDTMERRLNRVLYHRNRASEAYESIKAWNDKNSIPTMPKNKFITNDKFDLTTDRAKTQIDDFRDPRWNFNQN